jgi:ABC-type uncharacterized transport system substrate-binding protein
MAKVFGGSAAQGMEACCELLSIISIFDTADNSDQKDAANVAKKAKRGVVAYHYYTFRHRGNKYLIGMEEIRKKGMSAYEQPYFIVNK